MPHTHGSIRLALATIGKSEHEHDRLLAARWRDSGDRAARDALAERRLPLARALARRYAHVGEQIEDLEQVAALGLLHAIDRFDPAIGVSFTSFAFPTIRGQILHHVRDHVWSIRAPRRRQEAARRVGHARDELIAVGETPTEDRVAARAGLSLDAAREGWRAKLGFRSLSLERALELRPGDRSFATDDPGFSRAEARATLAPLLRGLDARSREVLRLRFEFDLTQSQIAERVGVSQMQVSRILRRALEQLASAAGAPNPLAA
jgi:RNA polymerase sigma-B factor